MPAPAQLERPRFELVVIEKVTYRRNNETGEVWQMKFDEEGKPYWDAVQKSEISDEAVRKRLFPGEEPAPSNGA